MNHSPDLRRRRRTVAATAVAGAGLLGVSLSTEPDSREFYALTAALAGVWTLGGFASGPIHLGRSASAVHLGRGTTPRRPVIEPAVAGAAAFGAFYAGARIAKRIPVLDRAITSVLTYAHEGTGPLVLGTALINGVAEEIFFRGAVYDATAPRAQTARTTAAYMVATSGTRNPALVLASGVMGTLFAAQRKATGGIQAPIITHVVWSTLMLRFLPPLFKPAAQPSAQTTRRFDRHRNVPAVPSRS